MRPCKRGSLICLAAAVAATFAGMMLLQSTMTSFISTDIIVLMNDVNATVPAQTTSQELPVSEAAASPSVPGQLTYMDFVVRDNVTRRPAMCWPVTNIVFIKTHKAGSSTVANILQRFGISRNLVFALPNTKTHSFGYNYLSKAGEVLSRNKLIPLRPGQLQYNILCNHAIYNRRAFHQIMPANSAYFSILREPFSQFVSSFEYYNVAKGLARLHEDILFQTNPISEYLANPQKYERSLFSYTKNKQAQDLGFGREQYFHAKSLDAYISQLDSDFVLFMIMEYFDESLLLLKRKFCWETKDILYFPKNKNSYKPKRNFTELDHIRHRGLNHIDYKLYDHYLKKLKLNLENQPPDFYHELANFKMLLKQTRQNCAAASSFVVSATRWFDEFEVSSKDCQVMAMSELAAFDRLQQGARAGTQYAELDFPS